MIGRLRENLVYKLLAVLCAIALRWYVLNQISPQQTKTVSASVIVRGVPQGYAVLEKDLAVAVTLGGTADELSHVTRDMVQAQIDLSHPHAGRNTGSITVALAPGHSGVAVSDAQPRAFSVTLEPYRTRRFAVQVQGAGEPAAGFAAGTPISVPADAVAAGPADTLDGLAALVVHPKEAGAQTAVDEDDPVTPVDDQGQPIPDIVVSPPSVHVRVPVVEAARERQAFVSPTISGAVAPGYSVQSVTASPSQVTLRGPAATLATAAGVVTEPVDITGASKDVVRAAACQAPAGLVLEGDSRVTVTVHVAPIGAVAPAGPASNPAPAGHAAP